MSSDKLLEIGRGHRGISMLLQHDYATNAFSRSLATCKQDDSLYYQYKILSDSTCFFLVPNPSKSATLAGLTMLAVCVLEVLLVKIQHVQQSPPQEHHCITTTSTARGESLMMQEHLMTCSWEGSWALHKVSTQQLFGVLQKKALPGWHT